MSFDRNLAILLMALVTASATASDPVRLTSDGRLKFSPTFVDGGKAIVYVDHETPTLYRLKKLYLANRRIEALHPKETKSQFEPSFARNQKIYAYAHTRGGLSVGINIQRVGAKETVEIKPGGGFAGLRSPAVSPDGKSVVFSEAEGGKQSLFVVSADGKGKKQLTDSRGINNWPHYSSDGKSIVFGSSRTGDFEIFVMQSNGSQQRRLTSTRSQDIRPRFSEDGRSIAFTTHRDGNAEVYIMNADGTQLRRITNHPERDDYPAWHPNGKQLVVVSERDGEHDLYLLNVN